MRVKCEKWIEGNDNDKNIKCEHLQEKGPN